MTDERACFLVRLQYPNNHVYWSGYGEKAAAKAAAERLSELDVLSEVYFGITEMSAPQLAASRTPTGCKLEHTQISALVRVKETL